MAHVPRGGQHCARFIVPRPDLHSTLTREKDAELCPRSIAAFNGRVPRRGAHSPLNARPSSAIGSSIKVCCVPR